MASLDRDPLFTVLIPVYNRADKIRPVLESVRLQTFEDFECLIIDDGSKDSEELKAIVVGMDDSRFIYSRQENQGASSARNRGIEMARGSYIAMLDSDDSFLPRKLEKVASVVADSDSALFVYSQMIFDRGIGKVWIRPERGIREGERVDEYLFCARGWILTSTMVLPRSVARRVLFDESLPSSQDADFAIRVANDDVAIHYIPDPLVIIDDKSGEFRVSKSQNYKALLAWIERARGGELSERAYWAYRGWHCARAATYSSRPYAIWLFVQSLVRGVYSFRHAAVIFAQVTIPQRSYQAIANQVVRLRGRTITD